MGKNIKEAAENYAHNYFDMHETNNYKALKQGFEKGAKWQQERSYSEEDMEKAIKFGAEGMYGWQMGEEGYYVNQVKRFLETFNL